MASTNPSACPARPLRRRIVWRSLVLTGAVAALAPFAQAQTAPWPDKPLHVIVPFAPGGPPDTIARLISARLGELLGQPVIVENRGGAGGNIGTAYVAKATDGHTILVTSSAFAVNTNFADAGYSAEKDFAPVTIIANQPNVVVVHPSVPVKNLAEFFAYAKERKLAFATPGSGTTPHLTGENLFNLVGKLGLPAIHYRGAGPAVAGVLSSEPPVGVMAMTAPLQNIKAGKLRALAVSSAARVPLLPDVPTLGESGYADMLDYTWVGVFLPASAPPAIVNKLHDALLRVLQTPGMKENIQGLAFETVADTPAKTGRYVKTEIARWGVVVKKTGVKPD